jgi:hypothetical protein
MHGTRQRDPFVSMRVSQVPVSRGETLTVWLGEISDEGGRTQVELRVLPDGTREVFVADGVAVQPIAEWYPRTPPEVE